MAQSMTVGKQTVVDARAATASGVRRALSPWRVAMLAATCAPDGPVVVLCLAGMAAWLR